MNKTLQRDLVKRLDLAESELRKLAAANGKKEMCVPRLDGEPKDVKDWGEVIEPGRYSMGIKSKHAEQRPDRGITQKRAIALAEASARKYPGETFVVIIAIEEYTVAVDVRTVEDE